MAAYRRVYGFSHLRADCRGQDQLRDPTLVLSYVKYIVRYGILEFNVPLDTV